MNYIDLDIMTRGGSDTDMEPSEEFPILFGLLTAPMTNAGTNGPAGSKPSSYLSKYFRKSEPSRIEPDSSALSDDEVCLSHDEDQSTYSYSPSGDEGSLSSSTSSDDDGNSETVVSSNSGDECYLHPGRKTGFGGLKEDEMDRLPSSTTVDDEDLEYVTIPNREVVAATSLPPPPTPSSLLLPNKALKRSYSQMACAHIVEESRSCDASADDGSDTEDNEIKSYCFNQDGLENLSMLQLNRFVSSAPSSSPCELLSKAKEDIAPLHKTPLEVTDKPEATLQPKRHKRRDYNSSIGFAPPANTSHLNSRLTSGDYPAFSPKNESAEQFSLCKKKKPESEPLCLTRVGRERAFNNNNNNNLVTESNATALVFESARKVASHQFQTVEYPTDKIPVLLSPTSHTATASNNNAAAANSSKNQSSGHLLDDHANLIVQDLSHPQQILRENELLPNGYPQSYKRIHCDLISKNGRRSWESHFNIQNAQH